MDILKPFITILILSISLPLFANSDSVTQLNSNEKLVVAPGKTSQIFYFWATWCPDCKEKLKSDLSKYQQNSLQLITLATDKDVEKISDYVKKNDIRWPVFVDQEKFFQKLFKVYSVPTAVLARFESGSWIAEKVISGTDWSQIDLLVNSKKGI